MEPQDHILRVSNEVELCQALQQRTFTCVMFSSKDCFFCRQMEDKFAQTMHGNKHLSYTTFVKVDVDDLPSFAERHDIMTLPTFLLFCRGDEEEKLEKEEQSANWQPLGRCEGCANKRPWHRVSQMIAGCVDGKKHKKHVR